jgi:hypothetical protein
VSRRSFALRTETFGLDRKDAWALPALRAVFAMPRLYRPLAEAWELHYPGTLKALKKLTEMGFLAHQPALIVDVRSGLIAARPAAALPRYRATAKGKRLVAAARQDLRVVTDTFPRTSMESAARVLRLMKAFNLESPHSRYGLSVPHAIEESGMPERSGRWWVQHLLDGGYLVELTQRIADVREVVPEHWRVTRVLCRQLEDVIDSFPLTAPSELKIEFRLSRTRFLADVDPARIGITGATDFDHDIETQRVLAAVLRSGNCALHGVFSVEPRINLPARSGRGVMYFEEDGDSSVFYQPDAEMREIHDGVPYRSVLEYERFQTRRDAWSHIERFLGWLRIMTLPGENAVLRFVVDTPPRVKSYVDLVEAFADWMIDHPEQHPGNPTILAVTHSQRLLESQNPLDWGNWHSIGLPDPGSDAERRPVLSVKNSPYDEYFARIP